MEDPTRIPDGFLHGPRVTQVANRHLETIHGPGRGASNQDPDRAEPLFPQAVEQCLAHSARGAGDQDRLAFASDRVLRPARVEVTFRRPSDFFGPTYRGQGVPSGHGRRRACSEGRVEGIDEGAHALVWPQAAGRELSDVPGHADKGLQRVCECVHQALGRAGQGKGGAMRLGHEEEIDASHALRSLEDDLVLQWVDVPGQLKLPDTPGAVDDRPPLVEGQVAIAAQAAPAGANVLDRAEKGLDDVEAMDAQVAEREPGLAIVRGQRTTSVGRIDGTAQDVDGNQAAQTPGLHVEQCPAHLRIEQERVAYAQREPLALGELCHGLEIGDVGGARFLDENMATRSQGLERNRRMAFGGGQDVDDVYAPLEQVFERGRGGDAETPGELLGPFLVEVGQSLNLDVPEAL